MGLCCAKKPRDEDPNHLDLSLVISLSPEELIGNRKFSSKRPSKFNVFAKPISQDVRIKAHSEFEHADTDKSGDVSLQEIRNMLFRLNAVLPKSKLKFLFEKYDKDKDGALSQREFVSLFAEADERTEIVEIFMDIIRIEAERGSGVIKGYISATGLQLFFQITAPEDPATGWSPPNLEQCTILINRYADMSDKAFTATGVGTKPNANASRGLTIEAFQLLITDLYFNGAVDPDRLYAVYQDMTRPLSHYFINSSHNTYLSGNQLNSASSADAVIAALTRGVRVIELDVWDASNSGAEPSVTHGRTLCTPTTFASCVKAIADYGFTVSDYPIILTIENHCTGPFQERMAKILFDHLGNRLFRFTIPGQDLYAGPEEWVSPAQLKGKVVLRDKPKRIHVRKTEVKKRPSRGFGRKSQADMTRAIVGSSVSNHSMQKDDAGSGRSMGSDDRTRTNTGTTNIEEDEDDFIDDAVEEEGVGVPIGKVENEARKLSMAIGKPYSEHWGERSSVMYRKTDPWLIVCDLHTTRVGLGGSVRLALEELGVDAQKVPWLQSTQQMMNDSVPHLLELVYIKNVKLRLMMDTSFKDPYKQLSFSQPPWRSSSSIVESKMLKLAKVCCSFFSVHTCCSFKPEFKKLILSPDFF